MESLKDLIGYTAYMFLTAFLIIGVIASFIWGIGQILDKEEAEQYSICVEALQDKEICFEKVYGKRTYNN